ncbi:MAG: ketohydroxyglutarate aldolase [Gemmatimonadota bacterium]
MTEHGSWVVTTSGTHTVSDVARALTEHGFDVEQVLDAVGVITGRCAASRVPALRRLAGVSDVSPDFPVDIGPPESPGAW